MAANSIACSSSITTSADDMIALLAWLLALPPLIALSIFVLETLLGLGRLREAPPPPGQPETVILMPAHNEAATIGSTLDRLQPALGQNIRLLVVADNCTDDTAKIIQSRGHAVVERHDPENRGKGFALAFGRDHLLASRDERTLECVVVLDADCETDAASLSTLTRTCVARRVTVQSRNILREASDAPAKVQMSSFAFWIKSVVRQRGGMRLGGAVLVTGTGTAYPWALFKTLPLATSNIVEDLAIGIHLTRNRQAPIYLDSASVRSAAADETATLSQRTRWEHGFLQTARTFAFSAIHDGILSRNRKLLHLGLHLLVPPLTLLLLVSLTALAATGVLAWLGGDWSAFVALAAAILLAAAAILLNWAVEGRRWLSARAMLQLPLYMVWKLPVYLGFMRGKSVGWVRTERTDEGTEQRP